MKQQNPSSVTIEEAVARMVNMDYIPEGFTLLEMTDAFREEAEIEYEDKEIDGLSAEILVPLKTRMEASQKRHALTQGLLKSLKHELKSTEGSMVDVADDSSSQVRLTLESVSEWAADRYGIGIPEWAPEKTKSDIDLTGVMWENVTIKIYKNNRIAYSFGNGKFKESTFAEIGLLDKRKNQPNQSAFILMGLSHHQKYPPNDYAEESEKTAISKLRLKLKKLTGLSADPFCKINTTKGWRPRFKLIDDRRNDDERAKENADFVGMDVDKISSNYDENLNEPEAKDFEDEDDAGGEWLEENE